MVETALLSYEFSTALVESDGGGYALDFGHASTTAGPTHSTLGAFSRSVSLDGTASARTHVDDVDLPLGKFCVRAVVRATGPVTRRHNIVESSRFPFALFLDKGASEATLTVVASVHSRHHGWRATDSRFHSPAFRPNTWLSIDMAYDEDTLALFVNGSIVDVQALPKGALQALGRNELFVGSWVDGRRDRFIGDLAALQLLAGIPEDLEARLDEARSEAVWHISRKRVDCEPQFNLGNEAGSVRFDSSTSAYRQDFERGLIMYHDSMGMAFEMHGLIWQFYKSYPGRGRLGYLVSDEGNSTKRGARKSLFSNGGIYWSGGTGAHPVLGQMYVDYENLGEAGFLGLPTRAETNVGGGKEQIYEHGRMYHKDGAGRACEVHGAILSTYLATGGVRTWGFPVTDEVDVVSGGSGSAGARVIGRSSEFERATIYWSAATGAFEVHGDIRRKYLECGGPAGELGLPTSNEQAIPGAGGARMNTFQHGSICWYGSYNSMVVARPFKIYVGRVATRESEGLLMGQNDLYVNIRATDGSQTYDRRHPSSGDWGGNNSHNIDFTIPNRFTPNLANYIVDFRFRCRDADPGADDDLGTFNKRLNAANGWGLRENEGVYNVAFSKVRSLTWSVKPQVDIARLSEIQKWWGVDNRGTPKVTYQKYARAFRDVDSDTEWWDLSDWLEKAFYELVIDDFTNKGNCFGMSLEGIYARKSRSVFGMPLDRFRNWRTLESEFNIKHCYQVGAPAIWWFLGQFVTGNTHDPKDVFLRSRESFERGEHPVICVAQNWDFSGSPHCILPVAWHQTSSQWKIDILDPNIDAHESNPLRELIVDPHRNTFRYVGTSTYTGGEWSGGRFHYMPFGVLDSRPRTPIWDAILLLLSGTVVIFAGDAETVAIKDAEGRDLDAFGARALAQQKAGDPIDDFFVPYRGFGAEAVPGGMLFRRNPLRGSGDIRRDGALAAHLPVGTIASVRSRSTQPLAAELRAAPTAVRAAVASRTAHAVLADASLVSRLEPQLVDRLGQLSAANREGTFKHRLRGKTTGTLHYAVCEPLLSARLDTALQTGHVVDFDVKDLASSKRSIALTSPRAGLVNLVYETRLGVGQDRMEVKIDRLVAAENKPLAINVRPGIGGVDVLANGERAEAQVSVTATIGGRLLRRAYVLPVEGGARINLATTLDDGGLSVGRIEQLFGPANNRTVIRPL